MGTFIHHSRKFWYANYASIIFDAAMATASCRSGHKYIYIFKGFTFFQVPFIQFRNSWLFTLHKHFVLISVISCLAYGDCARSKSGSQHWTVRLKGYDNSHFLESWHKYERMLKLLWTRLILSERIMGLIWWRTTYSEYNMNIIWILWT